MSEKQIAHFLEINLENNTVDKMQSILKRVSLTGDVQQTAIEIEQLLKQD